MESQKELTPEYIKETRELGLKSFYFFAKAVLGFDKLTTRFHKEMCDLLQNMPHIRRMWLLPRDHYKSTIVSIAYPLWLLAKNPEERILIAADTAGGAEKKLRKIRSLIESSPGIRAFFPEMRPKDFHKTTWSDQAITIPRKEAHAEPSIFTVGAGGAVIGMHFTRIILDDLVTKEAADSPTVMKRVIEWVDNVESLLERPYENTIDVDGTRWTHDDIYSHIESYWPRGGETLDLPFYFSYQKGFWEAPGIPLFPELYGGVEQAKDFADRMARQNAYLWSCNYENAPQIPEAEFNIGDLNFYTLSKDGGHVLFNQYGEDAPRVAGVEHLALYLTCDPAYSKARGSSFAAIIVSGVDSFGRVFILDALRGQWGGQGVIDRIIEFGRKYGGRLRAIGVEASGTQIAFVDNLRKEARRKQVFTAIHDLQPGTERNKEARIRFFIQPFVAQRRLFVRPDQADLLDELKKFPLSKDRDLLDALAYGAKDYWGRPVGGDILGEKSEEEAYKRRRQTANKTTGY